MSIRIKICCIRNIVEAEIALKAGAYAIGLVTEMPSGPGIISEIEVAKVAAAIGPRINTFLLTSKGDVPALIKQIRFCGVSTVQLCNQLENGTYRELKRALPAVDIIPVIHVTSTASIDRALAIASQVDGLLLDSGNPDLPVKELGGTGRTHDWGISRRIVELVDVPVYLAGGLNSGNVIEAIQTVKPFGVDVCSGVRSGNSLDMEKLASFIAAVKSASS